MRLRQLTEQSGIITINRQLNPKIWKDQQLDPRVREKLIEIAEAFEQFIGVELEVIDYTLTGSNANYTWNKYSDLDLHLLVKGPISEVEQELYSSKKSLWSEQRSIKIRGMPVECYVQSDQEPHHSTGVYSLTKDQWLTKPKKIKPKVDDAAIEAKKISLIHDIHLAINNQDLARLQALKEKIVKMRRAGLARAGEWSTENLTFKILRNMELIDQLQDAITSLEDQQLSLEQATPSLD
jgi:hypothetical protein